MYCAVCRPSSGPAMGASVTSASKLHSSQQAAAAANTAAAAAAADQFAISLAVPVLSTDLSKLDIWLLQYLCTQLLSSTSGSSSNSSSSSKGKQQRSGSISGSSSSSASLSLEVGELKALLHESTSYTAQSDKGTTTATTSSSTISATGTASTVKKGSVSTDNSPPAALAAFFVCLTQVRVALDAKGDVTISADDFTIAEGIAPHDK
jgi:hypothetical protein